MDAYLKVALSKGRILEESLPLLEAVGIRPRQDPLRSRRLVIDSSDPRVKLVVLRASDVPTYVQYGATEVGIAGKDVLMEHGGEGLYEPLDLGIARCRLMVAGRAGVGLVAGRARIATKFVNLTRSHFAALGRQVDVIKLYGSMELAPIVGLADYIVDLVASGETLRVNGLEPIEHIADISSRLIANKAAMKIKHREIKDLVMRLKEVVDARAVAR